MSGYFDFFASHLCFSTCWRFDLVKPWQQRHLIWKEETKLFSLANGMLSTATSSCSPWSHFKTPAQRQPPLKNPLHQISLHVCLWIIIFIDNWCRGAYRLVANTSVHRWVRAAWENQPSMSLRKRLGRGGEAGEKERKKSHLCSPMVSASLNGALVCPGRISGNKPFTPHIVFGHRAHHSNWKLGQHIKDWWNLQNAARTSKPILQWCHDKKTAIVRSAACSYVSSK